MKVDIVQKKRIRQNIENKVIDWIKHINDPVILKEMLPIIRAEFPKSDEISEKVYSPIRFPEDLKIHFTEEEDQATILDLWGNIYDSVLVSGGSIASMLLDEPVNDYDIYFTNKKVAYLVASYYLRDMVNRGKLASTDKVPSAQIRDNESGGIEVYIKSMGVAGEATQGTNQYQYFEGARGTDDEVENQIDNFLKGYKAETKGTKARYIVQFMTSNAITLRDDIQLIFRFCGNASVIHNNFDFTHCKNYWTREEGLVYNPDALQALLERRLYYSGSLFPLAAMFRVRKFLARGFRISASEIVKMSYDISKLDLDDPRVLREQLLGCDFAYFHQVVNMLKNRAEGIDRTYLFKILDEVFSDAESDAE